jgi:hypothetical protein
MGSGGSLIMMVQAAEVRDGNHTTAPGSTLLGLAAFLSSER